MLTTEDPQGLNDEIARLQRENQLMQQLLARQDQTAEDSSKKAPGQASAGGYVQGRPFKVLLTMLSRHLHHTALLL